MENRQTCPTEAVQINSVDCQPPRRETHRMQVICFKRHSVESRKSNVTEGNLTDSTWDNSPQHCNEEKKVLVVGYSAQYLTSTQVSRHHKQGETEETRPKGTLRTQGNQT